MMSWISSCTKGTLTLKHRAFGSSRIGSSQDNNQLKSRAIQRANPLFAELSSPTLLRKNAIFVSSYLWSVGELTFNQSSRGFFFPREEADEKGRPLFLIFLFCTAQDEGSHLQLGFTFSKEKEKKNMEDIGGLNVVDRENVFCFGRTYFAIVVTFISGTFTTAILG